MISYKLKVPQDVKFLTSSGNWNQNAHAYTHITFMIAFLFFSPEAGYRDGRVMDMMEHENTKHNTQETPATQDTVESLSSTHVTGWLTGNDACCRSPASPDSILPQLTGPAEGQNLKYEERFGYGFRTIVKLESY